jgi:hypothetical protein
MKIKITKVDSKNGKYMADLRDLPGSPPIGYGDTPEESVGRLFWALCSPDRPKELELWTKHVDTKAFEIIREDLTRR